MSVFFKETLPMIHNKKYKFSELGISYSADIFLHE